MSFRLRIVFKFNFYNEGVVHIVIFFAGHNLEKRSNKMMNKVFFRNNVKISLAEKTLLKLYGVAQVHTMEGDWCIRLPPSDSFLLANV